MVKRRSPVHPGEILERKFLKPLGMTQYQLSKAIKVQQTRISQIVRGRRGISAETAMRLGRFFGNGPDFWMRLQARYELEIVQDELGLFIDKEVQPMPAQVS